MNTYVTRALRTTLLAGGLVLAGTAAAYAADTDGIGNESEVVAPVTVDVDLSGLAIGLLGDASSTVVQPAPATPATLPAAEAPPAELPVQAPADTSPAPAPVAVPQPVIVPQTDGILNGITLRRSSPHGPG